jgi:hypothetical protein
MSLGEIVQVIKLWNWAAASWKRALFAAILTPLAFYVIFIMVFVEIKDRTKLTMSLYFKIVESLGFGYEWAATYQTAIYASICTLLIASLMIFCIFLFANEIIKKTERNANERIRYLEEDANKRVKKAKEDANLAARLGFIRYIEHQEGKKRLVGSSKELKWNQESAQSLIDQLPTNLKDIAEDYMRTISRFKISSTSSPFSFSLP